MATAIMSAVINGQAGAGSPLSSDYSQLIAFGDGELDSGYYFTHPFSNQAVLQNQYLASVSAGGGIPTSVGGVMNTTLLAQDYGLTLKAIGQTGGTNYAASLATITGKENAASLAPAVVDQIATYLATSGNHADPNALYVISGGQEDSRVASALGDSAAQIAYMVQQGHALAHAIELLYAAGARYIINTDRTGPGSLGRALTDTVWSDLAANSRSFIAAQVNLNVTLAVTANPTAFGITNTLDPPAGPFNGANPYVVSNGGADINPISNLNTRQWALFSTQLVSPSAGDTYLWADADHYASAGQRVEANYLYSLLQHASPVVSEVLAVSANVATDAAARFAFQWQRLSAGQTSWLDIPGATQNTYVVQPADAGAQLHVKATYIDAAGQSTAVVSAATAAVAGAPTAFGTPGNDQTRSTAADELLDGGGGLDTAAYAGTRNQYALSLDATSIRVTDTVAGRDGSDVLKNVERLKFSDTIVAIDLNGDAGQAYRMYQAAFARTPDKDGVSFWVSQVDKGVGLHDLAVSFMSSAEFKNIYGASPSVPTLVTGFYTNVLGRAPDASGLSFWVGQVQSGLSTADMLVSFSESGENKAHVAPAIQNGIELSLSFFS